MFLSDFEVSRHEARHVVALTYLTHAWPLKGPPVAELRCDRPIDSRGRNPLGWMQPDVSVVAAAAPSASELLRVFVITCAMGYMGWKEDWPPSWDDLRFLQGDASMDGLPELVHPRGAPAIDPDTYEAWMDEARALAADFTFRAAVGDLDIALGPARVMSGEEVSRVLAPWVPIWTAEAVSRAERLGR